MHEQKAIDRILEVANLTEDLEDDDANWLINWGVDKVKGLVAPLTDVDAVGDKTSQLMDVMRKLNKLAAARKSPKAAADIGELGKLYAAAFGSVRPLTAAEAQSAAQHIATLPPRGAIEHVLTLLALPTTAPTQSTPGQPTKISSNNPPDPSPSHGSTNSGGHSNESNNLRKNR